MWQSTMVCLSRHAVPFDGDCRAVLIAAGGDFVGEGEKLRAGVLHRNADAGHLDHAPVVQSVADGHGLRHGKIEIGGERRDGLALVGMGVVDLHVTADGGADA